MTNTTHKRKYKLTKAQKQLLDYINSDEFREQDPKWQRMVEIAKEKHMPLMEIIKIVDAEFPDE